MSTQVRKVLVAAINGDHPQEGMLHAFRSLFGAPNVIDFDFMELSRKGHSDGDITRRFEGVLKATKPDWVWLQVHGSTQIAAASVAKARALATPSTVVTHWVGDMRATLDPPVVAMSRICDRTFLSSVGQIPLFEQHGARSVRYLQIGLDWQEDVLGLPEWEPPFRVPEIVFIGGYYGAWFGDGTKERETSVRTLRDAGFDVGVVGTGWPNDIPVVGVCHVKQQHHVWKRAKVALSVNHFNHVERYYSDRQLIAMASGTPVVCRKVPGLQREFVDGKHCLFFETQGELVDRVQDLLAYAPYRRSIGAAGRAQVIRRHTWTSRLLEVLPQIEEMRGAYG